jgi:glycerol-3-phosphate dehydrogenase subunit B
MNDVLIVGAGLAGLTAAWQVALRGKKVQIAAKGWGTTHWHAGCIDMLGYHPIEATEAVTSPRETIAQLIAAQPQHPYALAGLAQVEEALTAVQTLFAEAGYPLHGSLDKNWQLPTAVGSMRPTCLAPTTMIAGDLTDDAPALLVGFEHYNDFYPLLAAENLTRLGIPATGVTVTLPTIENANFMTPIKLAQQMDEDPTLRLELARAIRPHLGEAKRVGLPAILGVNNAIAIHKELEGHLGVPVFEIPSLPPSVPGIRLHHVFVAAIRKAGGRVYEGMEAIGSRKSDGGEITAVLTEAAGRSRPQRAETYVLATGGILGGGVVTHPEGGVREVVFDLPLDAPAKQHDWFQRDFLNPNGHPIYQVGVNVNQSFQPVSNHSDTAVPLYNNLYAAGGTLAHCEAIRESSVEGVALVTGYQVGRTV